MAKCLYFDLFSGASGDMLLGALLDLGLALDDLKQALARMDLSGYELETERQIRHGLTGTKLHVHDVATAHPARHLSDVRELVMGSSLSRPVKTTSMAVFERLARVEANIHGSTIDHVHFHEISAVDSLVDIVGCIAGLEILEVKRVYSSPVPLGSGTIETAHGLIPVPAPATLALLAEVAAPTRPHQAETEIVTPTAAALLSELATFERPPMRVQTVGYGFGQKDFPWANAVRAWLGELPTPLVGQNHDQVVVIECNIDDTTGEVMGYSMERLFQAGALDVWFTSAQMKKNRPGVILSVLAHPDRAETIARLILRETSTLGLRVSPVLDRLVAERQFRQIETPWGPVQVKEKWLTGELIAVSPEFEDCARIAREHAIPLAQVFEAAIAATR
ncbi:MAG: nickel pincer cofactor biosynthesis protein LarC [Chloroflexi bacterium]|nr:nickel pincer cofactor biosynthesis protein LarC [Chloroflexota bacterium]